MPQVDWQIPVILGGVFILLGVATIIWGKREQARYDAGLYSRYDVREFLEHWPPRFEAKALIIGGWIAIVVGLVLLGMGFLFLTRGAPG